ncbi:MAG: ABC transporter permease, partial [Dehalococcoidales bacterium]
GLFILLLAPLIGINLSLWTLLALVPLMLLLAVSLGSMGILLATRIRSMEAFQATMQMLMFPMVFLSGAFFPMEGLPAWMSILVKINPATYGITPIRQVILGADPSSSYSYGVSLFGQVLTVWNEAAILAGFGAIMILLAMWSFGSQQ